MGYLEVYPRSGVLDSRSPVTVEQSDPGWVRNRSFWEDPIWSEWSNPVPGRSDLAKMARMGPESPELGLSLLVEGSKRGPKGSKKESKRDHFEARVDF